MDGTAVTLRLNQQQVELLDRTVAEQGSADRAEVVRRALREYHEAHGGAATP